MSEWPKHLNGKNKKIGEMTQVERKAVFTNAVNTVKKEFENPLVQEKLAAVLNNQSVNN